MSLNKYKGNEKVVQKSKEQTFSCPRCGETKTHKRGTSFFKKEKVQLRQCTACGYIGRAQKFLTEE